MYLGPLATTDAEKKREAKARSRSYDLVTVDVFPTQKLVDDGWHLQTEMKSGKKKLKRQKDIDALLENNVWNIFHDLGFDELSVSRYFRIKLANKANDSAKELEKQIDVFAKDAQTVFVVECKASKEPTKRSLLKDLNEFANIRKSLAESIRKHYGGEFKPKIVWCFFTRNIIWTENDETRARTEQIHIVRDDEILYFAELAKTLGPAARYQFHAEFLRGQKVPELFGRKCAAVKTKVGPHTAYSFFVTARDLLSIAYVSHKSLRHIGTAMSYQRMIKPERLTSIKKFLINDGFFPNSIIANFKTKIQFQPSSGKDDNSLVPGMLILPEKYQSCWIIDGQHRLYGCSLLDQSKKQTLLPVLAFECAPDSLEAELFATINKEQVKVPPRLLDEINGEIKWDSPLEKERAAAIAVRLFIQLRADNASPFYNKVQTASVLPGDEHPLTLSELKKSFLSCGFLGQEIGKEKLFSAGLFSGTTSEQALKNAREGLNTFFEFIRDANPERWDAGRPGYLCSNFGVPALMRLLRDLVHARSNDAKFMKKTPLQKIKEIETDLEPVVLFIKNADDQEFEARFKVTAGSGGIKAYAAKLKDLLSRAAGV